MPRKVRQLLKDLKNAGFTLDNMEGDHRKYRKGSVTITVSGAAGDDVHHYQEKEVKQKILQAKAETE